MASTPVVKVCVCPVNEGVLVLVSPPLFLISLSTAVEQTGLVGLVDYPDDEDEDGDDDEDDEEDMAPRKRSRLGS